MLSTHTKLHRKMSVVLPNQYRYQLFNAHFHFFLVVIRLDNDSTTFSTFLNVTQGACIMNSYYSVARDTRTYSTLNFAVYNVLKYIFTTIEYYNGRLENFL